MMQIVFWGVRGSVPTPLTPDQVRSKISTTIARATPEDLSNGRSREAFLARLPQWLFGCTGSNTSCVEIRTPNGRPIILDAGSGLSQLVRSNPRFAKEYHLFFSHFHYDHLQGLPFFTPAYLPGCRVNFYSPIESFRSILLSHMKEPYFPVTMESAMGGDLRFHVLRGGNTYLEDAEVHYKKLNHPGGAFAYKVVAGGKSVIYATDTELDTADFEKTTENMVFFQDADMVILDAQYTLSEAIRKYSWGHSSYSLGVDFAKAWNIRKLFLFHHEPQYDDRRLHKNLSAARWYAQRIGFTELVVELAQEGRTVEL